MLHVCVVCVCVCVWVCVGGCRQEIATSVITITLEISRRVLWKRVSSRPGSHWTVWADWSELCPQTKSTYTMPSFSHGFWWIELMSSRISLMHKFLKFELSSSSPFIYKCMLLYRKKTIGSHVLLKSSPWNSVLLLFCIQKSSRPSFHNLSWLALVTLTLPWIHCPLGSELYGLVPDDFSVSVSFYF